jgi:hypothetical protein
VRLGKMAYCAAALALLVGTPGHAQEGVTLKVSDFAEGGPDEIFAKLAQLEPLAAAGKGKIAALLPDTRSSTRWMTADAPGFEQAFAGMGLTPDDCIISNAQGSPQTQRRQAEQAITSGASVLLITNLDSGSAAAIQADAESKGVIVIDYDRLTLNGSADFYISFDNKNVGERMAEGFVECIADWGVESPHIFHLGGSPNLAYTHTPKIAINDRTSYALGWITQQTPNGNIVWHNGGTYSFGAIVVLQPDRKLGVIVLSNQTNVGMPDAIGLWAMDRLLGNPIVDYGAQALARAKNGYADDLKHLARPSDPQPSPPLAPLVGNFAHPGIGKAVLKIDGDIVLLELAASGARLRLEPWDGAVYSVTLLPDAGFAAMVANLNPVPLALAQFQNDQDGKPSTLRLTFADGEAYDLKRE